MFRWILAILIGVLAPVALFSQEAPEWIKVSPEETASHLLKRAEPVYPEFAKAAGVEGIVRFRVSISIDGHISGYFFPAGGPPALVGAAQQALTGYIYKPFQKNGQPANATTIVEVQFKLPPGTIAHTYPLPALTSSSFLVAILWLVIRFLSRPSLQSSKHGTRTH